MPSFWDRINNWYFLGISGIFILALVLFFFLKKGEKEKPEYYLPFSLIFLTVFYEFLAAATVQFVEINNWLYQALNHPQENNYNIWVYNFFGSVLTSLLFLALIYRYLFSPIKRKVVKGLTLLYMIAYLTFKLLGIETLFEQQAYSIFVGHVVVIVACGLYFIELITHPDYIEINPLKAFSFWQVTLIFFNHTMVVLLEISHNYLLSVNRDLLGSLYLISMITWTLILLSFLMTIFLNTRFFTAKSKFYL